MTSMDFGGARMTFFFLFLDGQHGGKVYTSITFKLIIELHIYNLHSFTIAKPIFMFKNVLKCFKEIQDG